MSFDIFFQPCRFRGTTVQKTNTFTGKVQSVLANEPLTAAELEAVQNVLKQANAHGPMSSVATSLNWMAVAVLRSSGATLRRVAW